MRRGGEVGVGRGEEEFGISFFVIFMPYCG